MRNVLGTTNMTVTYYSVFALAIKRQQMDA